MPVEEGKKLFSYVDADFFIARRVETKNFLDLFSGFFSFLFDVDYAFPVSTFFKCLSVFKNCFVEFF